MTSFLRRFSHASLLSLVGLLWATVPSLGEGLPDVSARPRWKLMSQSDDARSGYVLHRRETPGSNASTFRLEATVDSPPELVAQAAAKIIADPAYSQANTDKQILRNDEDALVVYSYIHIRAPFVSDRDVISRIERSYDPDSRTHRVEWKATNDGPPKKDGVVRLEHSEGYWAFSPAGSGKTHAIYQSHTEIDGYVPAWVVNTQMKSTMLEGIEGLREAVERERQAEGIE